MIAGCRETLGPRANSCNASWALIIQSIIWPFRCIKPICIPAALPYREPYPVLATSKMRISALSRSTPILLTYFSSLTVALDRQTSIVGNIAIYSGTPVAVYPTLPTLIYNCNELQAICQNVQEYITTNTLISLGTGWDFHYQHSPGGTGNTKKRGRQVCPSNWNTNRNPPCGSQQGQPNVNPGQLPPTVLLRPPLGPAIFQSEISDAVGNPSGMAFTCDEFPARS